MTEYQLGAPSWNCKTFLVFTYISEKDAAKISKVPGAERDVNPARQ